MEYEDIFLRSYLSTHGIHKKINYFVLKKTGNENSSPVYKNKLLY